MEPMCLRREVLPPRQAPCDPRELACDLEVTKRKRAAIWMLMLLIGSSTALAQLLEKLL